jgi:hypothetical protein
MIILDCVADWASMVPEPACAPRSLQHMNVQLAGPIVWVIFGPQRRLGIDHFCFFVLVIYL